MTTLKIIEFIGGMFIISGICIFIGIGIAELIMFIIKQIKSPKYNLWVNYQPNPQGKNTLDCSIRAISKIFNVTWLEALDLIVECAKKYCEQTNCSVNLNTLLYEKLHMHIYEPKKEITFEKFAHLHSKGTYALNSKGHICACIDGKLYDSWDSSLNKVIFYCAHTGDKIAQDKDITFAQSNECKNNIQFGYKD